MRSGMYLEDYDVFFFDLDGLLVDTEPCFYRAFLQACAEFSLEVHWDFSTYYSHTTLGTEIFSKKFIEQYPQAQEYMAEIFAKRLQIYYKSLEHAGPALMPGVEAFIELVLSLNKTFGVVTNSPRDATHTLRTMYPILNKFLFWVTRENYARPKPYGDSYDYAYRTFAREGMKVIGFEDSVKGLRALSKIPATLVCINSMAEITPEDYPELKGKEFFSYPSFDVLTEHCSQQKLL
ncbi:Hydrolase, haloacid dehalogenase-like family [Chlamydia pneumoniae]|uniref:Hydrolase, haloacid dehalogenase-like family n=1 Tax=Chlamydia pneumoniae TaxID=83558 RepID=A0A0F7WGG2_CHLPN|nr:Hydrolase, haloacid dehalogenase-like family [Chlamydia pneumoniae]CRI35958.1 Hydrolase, haloacid dehalogenase-like family [Chlamydia pneumoniae]CRI37085.1 Hydrolase, haloacid dehalogenase-like family [Chlamydia pneumoniae]CRI38213.1 Hydrolase, haloacid dehalogenase-like family [Chlamydia pneumoniae]CRI39345.1 Hydrolase, haloacid dehalogenase-like family [Chlamydia pneumoniae]